MGKYPVSFTDKTRKKLCTLKVGIRWSIDDLYRELHPHFGKVNVIYFGGDAVTDVRGLVVASISLSAFPVVM